MSNKKYVSGREASDNQPAVKEAKAQPYVRDRRNISQVALNIASVKKKLKKPAKRSNQDIAWALEIAGIGEGPRDLSENTRKYLYSD